MNSKNTLAISYNHVVHGFNVNASFSVPEYYNFAEGVWNDPPQTYGDSVLLKGNLGTIEAMQEFVSGIDRRVDLALIYAGSLKPERRQWLIDAVKAVRHNNPACELLIYVCVCAQHELHTVRHLMKETNTDAKQWFEQSHIGTDPHFGGIAPNLGNNPMWYCLMITRRYGQATIEPVKHMHGLRANPPKDEPGVAQLMGKWLTQI